MAMSEDGVERDGVLGFIDSQGKWVTATEFEREYGDELDHSVRHCWERLADIGLLNVRRNDDGDPVTAQLSGFAVDLYELPEDASVDEHVAVYVDHGVEPPEDLREEYLEQLEERASAGEVDDDAVLGGRSR